MGAALLVTDQQYMIEKRTIRDRQYTTRITQLLPEYLPSSYSSSLLIYDHSFISTGADDTCSMLTLMEIITMSYIVTECTAAQAKFKRLQ